MRFIKKSIYDKPIDKLLIEMDRIKPQDEEYSKLLNHVDLLSRLQERERNKRVKSDTVWLVVGNIAGILAIVAYEQKHVMASRGMNFILRPKT